MFGPEGVAIRRPLVAAFVLLTLVTADAVGPLRADSVSGPQWSPSYSSRDSTYGPEDRAQELYLDAMDKLEAGHRDWARTTFEGVIAQYPATTAATLARRQLGTLYRDDTSADTTSAESAPAPVVSSPPPAAPSLAPPSIAPPAVVPAAAAPASPPRVGRGLAWEQELRRNAAIQAKLRNEAGDRVFFSPDSAELGSRARSALAAQAQWLKRWHEFEAAVEGHADEPGSERDNLDLSARRAEAVRQRLIDEGVEPSRVAIVPLGSSERLASCEDPDCRAQNRRSVTLVFASGTRERLGLVDAPASPLADRPAAALVPPARTVEVPAAAQPAGVTR